MVTDQTDSAGSRRVGSNFTSSAKSNFPASPTVSKTAPTPPVLSAASAAHTITPTIMTTLCMASVYSTATMPPFAVHAADMTPHTEMVHATRMPVSVCSASAGA